MAVYKKEINEINWFFGCWFKFGKTKSYCSNFLVAMVNNGHGRLDHGTLKSAVSEELNDELSWTFACWCKFRKAKSYFNKYWVGMMKNEHSLLGHGTLKFGESQEWFDELSWFLYDDSNAKYFW